MCVEEGFWCDGVFCCGVCLFIFNYIVCVLLVIVFVFVLCVFYCF